MWGLTFFFISGLDYVFRLTFMHCREEVLGFRGILTVLLSEWQEFCFFSPCLISDSLPLQYMTSQSKPAAPDRACLWLVKEGELEKPLRLILEMEFWNLVWQAQAPLPPRSFQGSCSGFQRLCAAIPLLWAGWGCPVINVWLYELSLKRAAGSCRRGRWVFNIVIKYEEETPCSSWLQVALGSSSLVWNAAVM